LQSQLPIGKDSPREGFFVEKAVLVMTFEKAPASLLPHQDIIVDSQAVVIAAISPATFTLNKTRGRPITMDRNDARVRHLHKVALKLQKTTQHPYDRFQALGSELQRLSDIPSGVPDAQSIEKASISLSFTASLKRAARAWISRRSSIAWRRDSILARSPSR
jgi:hypothetical protein